MRKFNYAYVETPEYDKSQYENIDFYPGKAIDARYIHADNVNDQGNPFIEALPKPRISSASLAESYDKGIDGYNRFSTSKTYIQKLSELSLLDIIRFQLPFNANLEITNYNCLINSYRLREFFIGTNGGTTKLIGNSLDASATSYNLLGASGSGKSSALKILFSRYPQLIRHHLDDYGTILQIVYIVVNAVPNSNFKVFYDSVAKAIDVALGYDEPVYEKIVSSKRSLGDKAQTIGHLIEKFSIGMIVIDEIQLMSFSQSYENSYVSLARLSNETKVCIVPVGMPESVNRMFSQEWTARRVGPTVWADLYCSNYKFFEVILKKLSKYNWLKFDIEFTEEGKKQFYKLTNGVIAYIVLVYKRIQIDNISNEEQVVITEEYINKVMNTYYSGLVNTLTNGGEGSKQAKQLELEQTILIKNAQKEIADEIDRKQQEKAMKEAIAQQNDTSKDLEMIKTSVITNIKIIRPDYNNASIENAFAKATKQMIAKKEEISYEIALRKTFINLEKESSNKRKKEKLINQPRPTQVSKVVA